MRRAAWIAAALLLSTSPAFPADLPAKNLAFEQWDEAREWPQGWGARSSPHFKVARDCEVRRAGRCTLRISASPERPAGDFQPLGQGISPGSAAGHYLRLSGWIRTAGVEDGWAGLWARTDVEGKPVALQNMMHGGPRGTTDWQRFEVLLPVASNATLVAFGVLLTGRGTAWFDALELAVDPSQKVGPVAKTQVVDPPRPPVSARLMDDAALALAATQLPRAREHWVEETRRIAQPIRSLTSEDFSDLQFLKPLLAGRRVVQLGESGHGVAEFNWLKVRLAKFLHREMGFDVIAFESSLAACDLADRRVGASPPVEVMRACIFPVWHTTETLGIFEYLDTVRAGARPLFLAGFDTQDSSTASAAEVSERLVRMVARVDADLAQRIRGYEGQLKPQLAAALAQEMRAAYAAAAERLARDRDALRKLEAARPVEVDLALQHARSRVRFVDQLARSRDQATAVRDEGMADNLDFVLDTLHPGRKVIVWAHNFHIAKRSYSTSGPRVMGSWVSERRGAEVYTLGLVMGRGVATLNNRSRYEVVAPPEDSLEAILANAGWRNAFVDMSGPAIPADSWRRMPITTRDWGTTPVTIVPAELYDGLIYIDTVTPPEYL
jgi:erythromycin esterase